MTRLSRISRDARVPSTAVVYPSPVGLIPMAAYYNENDPHAAQWLRNLSTAGHIANGDVDQRSIIDVRA